MFEHRTTILEAYRSTLAFKWVVCAMMLATPVGCGQRGPLYIPADDPAAAQRATLPGAILNIVRTPKVPTQSASTPAKAASSASNSASESAPAKAPSQAASGTQ